MLSLITSFVVAGFGENIAALIHDIIGPIFLAVMGIIAITFAVRRQLTQFLAFLLIGVGIAAIIYAPDFIKNLGEGVGGEVKW